MLAVNKSKSTYQCKSHPRPVSPPSFEAKQDTAGQSKIVMTILEHE